MVKLPVPISEVMGSRDLSITSSPFAPGKMVIKRASFHKGVVPDHLRGYLIKKGECAGQTGTIVYKGKYIPKTAACVAERRR